MQELANMIPTLQIQPYAPVGTSYRCKIVTAGTKQQFYNYNEPQYRDYEITRKHFNKDTQGEKRQSNLDRTRNNMVLLIDSNSNTWSKLLTLTFRETTLDRSIAETAFKHFMKAFKREFGYKLHYIRVTERQKKRGIKEGNEGSIHFHLILFNNAKIDFKRIHKIWTIYGSIDIKRVDTPENLGRYLAKYLTKEQTEINKKGYTSSKGLIQPTVEYLETNFKPACPSDFNNSYTVYQPNQDITRETVCNFDEYKTIQRKPVTPYSLAVEYFGAAKVMNS